MSLDETMATPCYCCSVLKLRSRELGNGHASMAELDNALNELGMLSTITNSRQDYLHEKSKSQPMSSCLAVPEMCVLQMNSDFVTNFTFFKEASSSSSSERGNDIGNSSASEEDMSFREFPRRCSVRLTKSHTHLYRPYMVRNNRFVSRRKDNPYNPDIRRRKQVASGDPCGSSSGSSSCVVTRQDSGGKSNPGSPVKSQKKVTNTGCSIPRSRSLDDLEISKLNLNECSEAGRTEIEIVSQRINNLHVG